jgi:membrane-associated phospholipid phosphatase
MTPRGFVSKWLALPLACSVALLSERVQADDTDPASLWDPAWPRVTVVEVGVSAAVAGGGFLGAAAVPAKTPTWTHGVLFDDSARDALRASSGAGQSTASGISDAMLIALLAAPVASAGAVCGLRHDCSTSLQLIVIDAQAYALTEATVGLMKVTLRRERPDAAADGCETRPTDADCAKRVKKNSFPSDHAASSFVAASLMCTEHLHLGIAGSPYDATICATSLAAATTVSVLRVVADRHYASDIIAGLMIGAMYGWLMPTILHFHGGEREGTATLQPAPNRLRLVAVRPVATPTEISLGATFVF